MAADLTVQADLDLVMRTLIGEMYSVHPLVRQRSHWVMDAEMHQFIRGLEPVTGPPYWAMDAPLTQMPILLGLPVEIRDGVTGVRLEQDG